MNYRSQITTGERIIGLSAAGRLKSALDSKIQSGRDGWEISSKGSAIIHKNYYMSDDVFDLGAKILDEHPEMNPRLWAHWMNNTELKRFPEGIVIYCRSEFYCNETEKRLGDILHEHFGVPVKFRIDRTLRDDV